VDVLGVIDGIPSQELFGNGVPYDLIGGTEDPISEKVRDDITKQSKF